MIRHAGKPAKPVFGAGDPLYLVDPAQLDSAGQGESLSPQQSLSPLVSAIYHPYIARVLAGKSRFLEQSENHLPRDCPAIALHFSERNSGSSFFERKWTAGSLSRLDAEVQLQPNARKMDARFEIPLALP
jgi:hypothetical protein